MSNVNRQFVLKEKPADKLTADHFQLVESAIPTPGADEVLCKTRYISLDAANRAWMQGKTYRDEIGAGTVMAGSVLAEVVASNNPLFQEGDIVTCDGGWQEYFAKPGTRLMKCPRYKPLSHLMSVLGITGTTAYFGLLKVGDPQPGETVVVSAAGGAVGNVVGQIAKIKGCRAVGIAGGKAKCDWLVDELGFDAAIDYRNTDVMRALKETCPEGFQVYFDNVGGPILEAVLFRIAQYGRIVCCGAVSQYDTGSPAPGPRGVPGLIVTKRLRMQGFIVSDFYDELETGMAQLAEWVATGRLAVIEDVIEGFERTPAALVGLLAGENRGKRMVRVA